MNKKTIHTRKKSYSSLEAIKRDYFPRLFVEGEPAVRTVSNRPTLPSLVEQIVRDYEKSKAKSLA